MIISHKHKFLFIGLPFSASSAISKELYLRYEGKPFLAKHSIYYEFKKIATKEEKDYFVFAVLRNPMEIATTVYEKMKSNEKGNFTNPQHFLENGGHITKSHRKRFEFIHKKNATFQEYFKAFYKKPYDNLASLTTDYCDYVIRYENIEKDYENALRKAGVKNIRPLPVANKTAGKKHDLSEYYTEEIKEQAVFVFAPFFKKHKYSFPSSWGRVTPPLKSIIQFWALAFLRKINHRFFKKHPNNVSLQGTIYGDMQRKKLN